MTSPLLALFVRSLREDTHGKGTYWTRGALGGFILLVLAGFALTNVWTGAPGRNFFIGIVILQMISISFIGLSYFSSAIAEEKEEQTLGLLRMTDLNPLSILLGKSTSRLCGALLLLAAQFPFTVFAVTLGGVSLDQIVATYCTLAAYTFLLCNVALLGSVLARHTPGAAAFCMLVIGLLFGAGPLLGLLLNFLPQTRWSAAFGSAAGSLWEATPIARLIEVFGTGFAGPPAGWQVTSNLVVGVGCFLVAWAVFDRSCDRTSAEAVASGPIPRPAVGVRLGRPPRPAIDALVWKDYHFLCGGRLGTIVRVFGYGGALLAAIIESRQSSNSGPGGFMIGFYYIVPFVFSLDVAAMASRLVRTEIRDQTLSALAALPLTMRQLVQRKVQACLIAGVPGALSMVAGVLLFLLTNSASFGIGRSLTIVQALSGWVNVVLLAYVVAWLSLFMKRGALPVGFVVTQAGHTLISIVCMALTALIGFGFSAGFAPNMMSVMSLGPLVGCIASLVVAYILHRKIPGRLELLAGEN